MRLSGVTCVVGVSATIARAMSAMPPSRIGPATGSSGRERFRDRMTRPAWLWRSIGAQAATSARPSGKAAGSAAQPTATAMQASGAKRSRLRRRA